MPGRYDLERVNGNDDYLEAMASVLLAMASTRIANQDD